MGRASLGFRLKVVEVRVAGWLPLTCRHCHYLARSLDERRHQIVDSMDMTHEVEFFPPKEAADRYSMNFTHDVEFLPHAVLNKRHS